MAQFENATREVTLVFQNIGKSLIGENPIWRRAGFNLVSYDGNPDKWIEPVNVCLTVDALGTTQTILSTPATVERIAGIEYVQGRMFEVHNFAPMAIDVT